MIQKASAYDTSLLYDIRHKGALILKKAVLAVFAAAIITVIFIVPLFKSSRYKPQEPDPQQETSVSGQAENIIDVPLICQYPALPSGCESVSAAMVLRYYGADITAEEFASSYLTCSELYSADGRLFGPDPDMAFAGSPFSESYSYGCFAPVIVNAVNRIGLAYCAAEITGASLSELCAEYIDSGKPLLIWATMDMREPEAGRSWYLPDGTEFTWTAGEHCLVLVGYDEYSYFLNDPRSGGLVRYPKKLVERRFSQLGSQAVYICKK